MCTIQEFDNDIKSLTAKAELLAVLATCIKCKIKPSEVNLRDIVYCKECFLSHFYHKIRMILSKGKDISAHMEKSNSNSLRTGESSLQTGESSLQKVLVAVSGGLSSLALLHSILEPYRAEKSRKRQIEYFVVHIDESLIHGIELQKNLTRNIQTLCDELHLPLMFVPLEYIYDEENKVEEASIHIKMPKESKDISSNSITSSHMAADGFQRLWNATDHLNKEDLLCNLRRTLLTRIAKYLGCSQIYLGHSSTRCAVQCLSGTTKGKGYVLPVEMASHYQYNSDITLIKPFRDHSLKEINYYNKFHSILDEKFLINASMGHVDKRKLTIDSLTEKFIMDLDMEYPSTVSTLSRTANKISTDILKPLNFLSPDHASFPTTGTCYLCHLSIEPDHETSVEVNRNGQKKPGNSVGEEAYMFCYGCSYMKSLYHLLPNKLY